MSNRRHYAYPPIRPLFDREPWDAGPQSLPVYNSPAPDATRNIYPVVNGIGNANAPVTFPPPMWEAEAHRYAFCSNLVLPYTLSSTLVLNAPDSFRNLLMLRNLSTTQTVAVQFGSDAGASSVLQLTPGAFIAFDTVVPQDDMYIVGIAGTGSLACAVSTLALPPIPKP